MFGQIITSAVEALARLGATDRSKVFSGDNRPGVLLFDFTTLNGNQLANGAEVALEPVEKLKPQENFIVTQRQVMLETAAALGNTPAGTRLVEFYDPSPAGGGVGNAAPGLHKVLMNYRSATTTLYPKRVSAVMEFGDVRQPGVQPMELFVPGNTDFKIDIRNECGVAIRGQIVLRGYYANEKL